jgi:hypothetical protein
MNQDILKIEIILGNKFSELARANRVGYSRERAWDALLEDLGIEKMSKLMHLCVPAEDGEVRIGEPLSERILRIPRETAMKILP